MNIKNRYCLEVWIGLAKVKANDPNNIISANGSFVNVLGLSRNKNDFRKKVSLALKTLGLELKALEDAEPFSERILKFNVAPSLKNIAKNIVTSGSLIEFGTFHTYD